MTLEISSPLLSAAHTALPKTSEIDQRVMTKAREFEAVFVAQMLKHSGMGKALSSDSGHGGEAFSSMLLEQYAERIVENGGFGLADKIYEQLRKQGA